MKSKVYLRKSTVFLSTNGADPAALLHAQCVPVRGKVTVESL